MASLSTPLLATRMSLGTGLSPSLAADDYAAIAALFLASTAYITRGILWGRPDSYKHLLYQRPQNQVDATTPATTNRDIAELVREVNADIVILWASQSGTTERLAGRLSKEIARSFGAGVLSLDISEITPSSCTRLSRQTLVILMASTFGEGDPSDNMHDFWEWTQHLAPLSLSNFRYFAFGLGNSNYKHYNHVVKRVSAMLNAAGAIPVMPVGLADDAAGETEEHYLEWKEQVLDCLQANLGYERRVTAYEPSLEVVHDDSLDLIDLHSNMQTNRSNAAGQSGVFNLPILKSEELFAETTDRNCLHFELDLSGHAELKYKTGDHLGIWAPNPAAEVERLLRTTGLCSMRTTPCHVRSLDGTAVKVSSPTTIDTLFGHHLEICAPVSREHVALLATFAPSQSAKDFLSHISKCRDSYDEHLRRQYVTLGRVLEQACGEPGSWRSLPLSVIIEILPLMQPRYYSISSSSAVQPRTAAITAVVSDRVVETTEQRIPGLATNYLLAQHANKVPQVTTIHGHVRRSAFKLPISAATPILMVGAGTGIAPFRAFVQERARLRCMGREVGATKLFFGCRSPQQDFIYRQELAQHATQLGETFSLTTAFSRPPHGRRKYYVQDRIREEAEAVCKLLIDGNAYFYICGSAAMAREVSDTIATVIATRQSWSGLQVQNFIERQRKQKRWMQDVWG
jgi:NADPH-ferrihemoprotein reductase